MHLFGIVHFKTNYNYRLSNHCFINELILVTYALISNAVENALTVVPTKSESDVKFSLFTIVKKNIKLYPPLEYK